MNLAPDRETLHQNLYMLALALLVCSLPLSKFLLSVSQFLLVLNWIAEGRFREKHARLMQNPGTLLFASILLLYVAGMLYTTHTETGWMRVKNALPLMALPIIIGTAVPLTLRNFKVLLLLFSAAVSIAVLVCLVNYLTGSAPDEDFRKISLFMLHIRFSLLIVMSILILLYYSFNGDPKPREKIIFIISAAFLSAFLVLLRSFTGLALFLVTVSAFGVVTALQSRKPAFRYGLPALIAISILVFVIFTGREYRRNFPAHALNPVVTDSLTAGGNPYDRNVAMNTFENGHSINRYLCEPELRKEWNRVSTIPYDSADKKGQTVSYTLRRYLTSKGLRKDSAAFGLLTPNDIRAIESGTANYLFQHGSLHQRFYETLWEIHVWRNTGFVQNHTFGQRIVFVQSAIRLIRRNLLIGVGTGDVYDSMLKVTRDNRIPVQKTWEGKPHNQFAFVLIAFGLTGFAWFMLAILVPVYSTKSYRLLLFNLFMMLIMLSMLVLDTLESYDSIVFFAFFYSIFTFGRDRLSF